MRAAVSVPLLLHGTSGLDEDLIRCLINLGICKFNGNTGRRTAYINALRQGLSFDRVEVLDLTVRTIDPMRRGFSQVEPLRFSG
ncbi:MAG: class II fructose-bisphosphate aldolase [Desulfatiglandales bacterium]